jgi:hypothetical protein
MNEEILNAKITGITWDRERGMTQYIKLQGHGWGIAMGGYALTGAAMYDWMKALMDTFDLWEEFSEKDLIGRVVRVKMRDRSVYAIGDAIEDRWMCPKELFAKYQKEETQ